MWQTGTSVAAPLKSNAPGAHIRDMRYLAVVFLAILAGCQSKPIEQLSYTETKQLAQQLHKRCADQGAPQGSAEFELCMKQEIGREASIRNERAERKRNYRGPVVCNRSFNTVICT